MKIQNQVSSVGIDALAAEPNILHSPVWSLQLPKTNKNQRQRQIQMKYIREGCKIFVTFNFSTQGHQFLHLPFQMDYEL